MFDNLRDPASSFLEEELEELNKSPQKRVLRFRWPIYNISNAPLQERLLEFIERGEVISLEEIEAEDLPRSKAYLVRVFVEDADGRKYAAPIPEFLKNFNRELRKKKRS